MPEVTLSPELQELYDAITSRATYTAEEAGVLRTWFGANQQAYNWFLLNGQNSEKALTAVMGVASRLLIEINLLTGSYTEEQMDAILNPVQP